MHVHVHVNMPISSSIYLYKLFLNIPSSYLKCTIHCCSALSVQLNSSLEFLHLCFSSCDKYIILTDKTTQILLRLLSSKSSSLHSTLNSFIPHVRDCHTCLCSLISILLSEWTGFYSIVYMNHIAFLHSSIDTHLDFSVSQLLKV